MLTPWRLVADIGSSTMLSYSTPYNYNTTSVLLGLAYKHAHIEYYSGFKRALLSIYNKLKPYSYIEAKHCQSGRTLTKTVKPEEYSEQSLLDAYSEPYFLKLYLQIRLFEMEAKLPASKANRLINDIIELYRVSGIDEALIAFERIIGKTYNYSGSLTNLEKSAKLRAEEELQKEELHGAVSTYR